MPAVPKPVKAEKKPRKPLRRTPLKKINPERKAKVAARRAKQRRSPENKAAIADAKIRAQGICECGCGQPMDPDTERSHPDHPEAHHTRYDPPTILMMRRKCHHWVEMTKHGHRHR